MKYYLLLITTIFSNSIFAASVSVTFDPSPDATVVGYKIYAGQHSMGYGENFLDIGDRTFFTMDGLTPTLPYYFVVTAYTAGGLESDYSNEVSYTPPLPETSIALNGTTMHLNLFRNGQFWLQKSADLKTWDGFQYMILNTDTIDIPMPTGISDRLFFRTKFDGATWSAPVAHTTISPALEAQVNKGRVGSLSKVPPSPPLPPLPWAPKLRVKRKLKIYLHGAQLLMPEKWQ